MLIRNFLKTLTARRKSNSRRRLVLINDAPEQLESRTLLTGNVQVSLVGGNAQLTGDALSNEFEIVVENGSVVVRGLNGTTVNSGTAVFTLVNGATTFPGNLTASLGAGDDIVAIGPGITFAGNVSLSGDAGTDTLRALAGTYNGNLSLMGGDGVSSIVVDGATVSRDLGVSGRGATVVSITNSTVHGGLDAWTGLHNSPDTIVIKGTTVDRRTKIVTGQGDDNVVLQNSHLNGQLIIFTGAGDDVVYIDSSSVGKFARIATQRGDDTLQVLNSSSFSRLLVFAGGPGHDSANIASDTSTHRLIKHSQKAKYFNAATVASRITNPTTGAIAVANALVTAAVATLTVTTSTPTFAENAGASAATLTVTRTGPTSAAAIITLTSSNPLKATVPATITIPAGSTSTTATIAAVDNTTVDGAVSVTFTATATGFPNATAVVTVTDNETALILSASPTLFSESAGTSASTLIVTRTGPTTAAQVVTLTSSNPSAATVPASVTIPAGSTTASVGIAAVNNPAATGPVVVTITAAATGFAPATTAITVTDLQAVLTLTASPATFAETAGASASTLTVTRTGPTTSPLIVSLSSSNITHADVPATVTFPIGSASENVFISAVNDNIANSDATVTIIASATGFPDVTTIVTVTNANVATLTVTSNAADVSENAPAGTLVFTVKRNTSDNSQALVVNLSSNLTARLTVPATVTILAGQESVTFVGAPVDDSVINGDSPVIVTASASGFTSGSSTVTVKDNDVGILSLTSSSADVAETAGANAVTFTITRTSNDMTQPLVLTLSSSNTARLTVGSTVTIPANQTSATFTGSPVSDSIVTGNVAVIVRATAVGFADATSTVTINNTDVPTLTITTNSPTVAENGAVDALRYTVTRNTSDNLSALTVNLASNLPIRLADVGAIVIPANQSSVTFNGTPVDNGVADGNVDVVVTVSATGFVSGTTTVTVIDDEAAVLTVTANKSDVFETAGTSAVTYTVSRNTTDNSQPLVVNLTSGAPGRLSVNSTVTIPATAASVTFDGAAIDNQDIDGDVAVVVTASATGFTPGTASVTVKDDDAGTLIVTPSSPTISEGAAAGTLKYTITRTAADTSLPVTITLVSGTPGRLTVPETVTIEATQTQATFDATVIDDNLVNGNVEVIVTASASGFANTTASVTVNDNDTPTLTVTPTASAISENYAAGTFYYTVSRNTLDLTQALTVNLTSANTSRLSVPATITLRVGSAFEAFQVTPVNNTDADGNVDVTLTANATGFADASWVVTVIDDEAATPPPTLTTSLTVATLVESAPANSTLLTVTRTNTNTNTNNALVVNLTYSDPSRISGPATITIPATESSASVPLSTIDNLIVDGNIDEDISATAAGFRSSQTALRIIDNELATLSVTTAASVVAEDSGTLAGTVSTSLASSAPIVVSLLYQFSNVLTGPSVVVIPAGATSVPVTFTINNGSVTDQSIVARIATEAFGTLSGEALVTVTDTDSMALTATASTTDAVQSNGTIITRSALAQVAGTTAAGATITIDSDGDGVFDNGTTIAGNDGTYSVDVNLTNTTTNHGKNRIVVRAVDGPNLADTSVSVHMAVGTVVHFATNVGAFDVELLDTEADNTVTNFLSYVTSGAYQNMFVHRANAGSAQFIQGGGFKVSNSQITSVLTNAAITNQFNPANGNIAGTLAMALTAASIHSGTSGWFINTIDNSAGFDPGKYTVFGRVIGDGLTVAQQISSFGQTNLNTLYNSGALATVPLSSFNAANTSITGNVSTTFGSAVVTGTGTLFTSELAVGQSIVIGSGQAYFVASIESDTSLTLTQTLPTTANSLAVKKDVVPTDAEFVVFSSIGKILDTL